VEEHKCFLALIVNRAAQPIPYPREENGAAMKFATVSNSVVLGLALLLASSAFAATKAHLTLQDSTDVNGTKLKAGDYKLEWDGNGPNVEVSIIQGKTVVAKVPAKIVELKTRSLNDAAVVTRNGDGTTSLEGARFEGKQFALELSDSGGSMEGGSSR
jgi:hypothetical protein